MTMAAHLSAESADGWVSPDGLTARITLKNLFGTPAAGRRVTARVQLTPGFPTLRGLEDYRFSDPQKAKETFSDRSEEHTSELQSRLHLVCRLLLEKKKEKYAPR